MCWDFAGKTNSEFAPVVAIENSIGCLTGGVDAAVVDTHFMISVVGGLIVVIFLVGNGCA